MARILLLFASILSVAAATLSLQSCKAPPPEPAPRGPATDLVVLPDGTTMIARGGSLERDLVDWIGKGKSEGAAFPFPDAMFVGGSDRLAPAALGRTARLAEILKAAPDTRIVLRSARADGLAVRRAEALAAFLEERGVAKDRISVGGDGENAAAATGIELLVLRNRASEVALAS